MLLPIVALLLQRPWHDRATFNAAMARVQESMSPAQVRSILGPPDDIWTPADSSLYAGAESEIWCYGTQGHLSLPTLGKVFFERMKMTWKRDDSGGAPIPNLPPEGELDRTLRSIDRPRRRDDSYNPLDTIHTVNTLLPLGKERALAVMCEYERLGNVNVIDNWLFPVAFTLFESKVPFPLPGLGLLSPPPPKDPSTWPSFPMIVNNDVPFSFLGTGMLAGFPESFQMYAARASKPWTIRSEPLTPPNDPFPALEKTLLQAQGFDEEQTRIVGPLALKSLLRILREVYPTIPDPYLREVDAKVVEKHHAEFRKLGVRWSTTHQRYVRSDGTWNKSADPLYPLQYERLKTPSDLALVVSIEREDQSSIDYYIDIEAKTPKVVAFKVVDVDSGKVVSSSNEPFDAGESSVCGSGWSGKPGQRVRIEVTIAGKNYRSRDFKV